MLLTGISLIIQNTFCMTQPIIINLRSNEQSQELHFYPSEANQDKCAGICNTFDDLSKKVYLPNETEDSKLLVFNMASGIFESRTLTKHISCKCECKFDGRKNDLNQKWNNNNFRCKSKKLEEYRVCQKVYFWNSATRNCENGKYARSVMVDSVIACDKIIAEAKNIPTKSTSTKTILSRSNSIKF